MVALYLPQQSSRVAGNFLQREGAPLPFTPWHRLEVRNALRLAVFHKLIDAAQSNTQLKQVDADLQDESVLVHTPVDWVAVLRAAEKLGGANTETIGCRSGDLLHVATAVELNYELFLTFDERQKKMARAAGLTVKF